MEKEVRWEKRNIKREETDKGKKIYKFHEKERIITDIGEEKIKMNGEGKGEEGKRGKKKQMEKKEEKKSENSKKCRIHE